MQQQKKTLLTKLQTIQNKCLKVVNQMPIRTAMAEMHRTCSIKPLHYRREFALGIQAFSPSRA